MFRFKQITRAVMITCAGSVAIGASAQQQLERVEVLGSNIKRVNAESVSPVEIISREQIARSGQATVADLLRSISSNGGGSYGESASNSFAPGAAGVSLRGLGQKTTLVLLNGRRIAGYGFAQNLAESFVDINSIPSSAVESIQILKDGGSALYGSDAIAGVVNIILRREFKGLEVNGGGGSSAHTPEYTFNITSGLGDLASDKYNAFAVLDYYKRDEIMMSDTKFGESRDMRSYAGGRNFTSLTGGGTWRQLSATNALTNNYKAISGCTGSVLTGPQAVQAGLINVTPPFAAGVPGGLSTATYNTNLAAAAAANTFCTQNPNDQLSALPGTERVNLLTRGVFEFSPTTSAFVDFNLNRNKTSQTFTNPFFAGTTGLTPTAGGLRPFTYNINFAPGVAGNPFASNARYTGSLNDFGTRNNDITSDTIRFVGGLRYEVAGWDMESATGLSRNKATSSFSNRLSLAGTSSVFGVSTSVQPPIPLSSASGYNLDNPASNSAAVRDEMRANFPRVAESRLSFIDTKGSTELSSLTLPGGSVGVAVGAEFRREELTDSPDPLASSGGILGQGITATQGERKSAAVYTEFALPITKQIEAQLAARYDHYSDYGSSTTPKVGLKYTPNDSLAFRANWGKGFRAPTLPEISPSTATFFTTVIDPEDGVSRQVSGVYAGNPKLKAEHATSTTLGIVMEPSKNFSVSLDAYRIDWRDVVASPTFQSILDASCPAGGPACPSTTQLIRDPSTNQIVTILSNYQNLSSRKTSGLDVDARINLPTETMGKFGARLKATYVRSFTEDDVEHAGTNGGTNTIPRIKGSLALDWDQGPLSFTLTSNYTHSYKQQLLAASYFAQQDPRFQSGVYPERVHSFSTYDIFGRYAIDKNWSVSATVINLLNTAPPYDPGFSSTFLYDYSMYDVRGRQFRMNFNYKM